MKRETTTLTFGNVVRVMRGGSMGLEKTGIPSVAASASTKGSSRSTINSILFSSARGGSTLSSATNHAHLLLTTQPTELTSFGCPLYWTSRSRVIWCCASRRVQTLLPSASTPSSD